VVTVEELVSESQQVATLVNLDPIAHVISSDEEPLPNLATVERRGYGEGIIAVAPPWNAGGIGDDSTSAGSVVQDDVYAIVRGVDGGVEPTVVTRSSPINQIINAWSRGPGRNEEVDPDAAVLG